MLHGMKHSAYRRGIVVNHDLVKFTKTQRFYCTAISLVVSDWASN